MVEPSYANFSSLPEFENVVDVYNESMQKQFQDDGVWIISCSFTIFTMTSGKDELHL